MHRHSEDDIPSGFFPMTAEYDAEFGTFSVTMCLDDLHIGIAMPLDRPQTLGLLNRLSPTLNGAFMAMLMDCIEHNEEIKERIKESVANVDAAEEFLRRLDEIAPDEIVRAAQEEGDG